jgi:NAD(P)-dependent dehydrogenase (short-subunit alcohol dehydrogenase family)
VTGGGSGIGRATAVQLAGAGWTVVVLGRREEPLTATVATIEAAGGSGRWMVCDVTDEQQVRSAFVEIGDVDALISNAGASTSAKLSRTSLGQWRAMLDANATSAFLCLREVIPAMVDRGWGRAVVVASTSGLAGNPYISAYTSAKHAAVGLVRAVATEVAGSDVTVNAVCPTYVDTEMTAASVSTIAASTGRDPARVKAALGGSSPLGRLLQPQEVAAAVCYLCSAQAGAVNGQTLVLNGG